MNQKKLILCILAVLLTLTAVLAIIHLTGRTPVPDGAVAVVYQENCRYLTETELQKVSVQGTLINGKGQEVPVDAPGISLADALSALGIDSGKVSDLCITARDEFSAQVAGDELRQPGKVYLTVSDGSVTLVVFGDENAKRNVRNVALIEVN